MDKEKTLRKLKQEIEEVREKFGIEFAEVKHGRWEKTEDDFYMGLTIFKCSVCREEWVFEDMFDVDGSNYHYCPNCGADMRERRDNNA